MEKLNLSAEETGVSLPLNWLLAQEENGKPPRPGSFTFMAHFSPQTVESFLIEAKGPYYY